LPYVRALGYSFHFGRPLFIVGDGRYKVM